MNAPLKPNPLKQRWLLANAAFEARNKRERWLIVGAAAAAVFWLCDAFWLSPALKQWKSAQAQALQAEKALGELQQAQVLATAQAAQARVQRAAEREQLESALRVLEGRPGAMAGACAGGSRRWHTILRHRLAAHAHGTRRRKSARAENRRTLRRQAPPWRA